MFYYEIIVALLKISNIMKKLTVPEEEAMLVIWELKRGFIKDILEKLPTELPYTTLASTIRKLEGKGYVKAEKLGNAKRYSPIVSEKTYKRKFMKGFVSDYFRNSYKEMVNFFVEEEALSKEELKEIIAMIEQRKDH